MGVTLNTVSDTKPKDHQAPTPATDESHTTTTPKKRRKVNHACLYCRRSERPCTRCVKRNIGHLCHDEPREPESKKAKSTVTTSSVPDSESQPDLGRSAVDQAVGSMEPLSFGPAAMGNGPGQAAKPGFDAAALGRENPNSLQLVQPTPVSGIQASTLSSAMGQFPAFSDVWMNAQNHYHDMHSFHPNFHITPEVTNEFNLLNEFLHSSLLDGGALLADDQPLGQGQANSVPALQSSSSPLPPSAMPDNLMPPPPNSKQAKSITRPTSALPTDKAREYYFQAADPSGNADPEERMQHVLRAKYEAGLLKPFNYIKGYARLSGYLDTHVATSSKQKILRQLDRFRPKFREKMQALTDIDLILAEMWFERTLMEYDRVFASMAVPACCWRRTGEIFRGNKEFAELIHVPVEDLRGGKIALHEILTEESNVRYWEEFGTIAFDPDHETLFTACCLKSPDDTSSDPVLNCCFTLRIRRDDNKIPSLIVGNFLPHDPPP
ncbi:hypothetical protein B0T26DRAFT_656249 [Lasiosphaeria miniovina]|uniref:ERT1/acuK family PAS domain-containing protein n=1 Tax=Lasiosphaeria miniovina TaxID=1954250 RepID=A0AA40A0B8_9PEZI|nr:uncharacterized protein B0T26DRAFT_656249 [Lasiosphaeria miniovina]KAK0706966.1 hypothetical protein B0T26DRAFT_656249 [Lasiosphaeria miniovina]